MAKKKAKSSKKSASKKSTKTSKKKSSKKRTSQPAAKTAAPQAPPPGCSWCRNELEDEHRVLSHLMYILFLFAVGFAAIFTVFLFTVVNDPDYRLAGVKALVLLAWAFVFKTFGHRIHVPHH